MPGYAGRLPLCLDVSAAFPRITHRMRVFDAREVPVPRWFNTLDNEDKDWLFRHWTWMDEFDWLLEMAGVSVDLD